MIPERGHLPQACLMSWVPFRYFYWDTNSTKFIFIIYSFFKITTECLRQGLNIYDRYRPKIGTKVGPIFTAVGL